MLNASAYKWRPPRHDRGLAKERAVKMTERQLHGYVADLIRLQGVPGLIAFHPANEGQRSPRTGAFLKRMMMVPGVADFAITLPGGRQCFLELKAPGRYPTEDQRAFRALCERNGTPYAIARTPDEARIILEQWGAIRAVAA